MRISNKIKKGIRKAKSYKFLFEELVQRDFNQKYKRTILGMGWSILSPLLHLLVMKIVFTQFFGRGKNSLYYTTYLFSGNIMMSFYKEATKNGMSSLFKERRILQKINVPKYLFLLSKNVSAFVNFMLTLVVFFIFCFFDKIKFGPHMLMILYPISTLLIMNIGIGMILSALYVFFRDIQYLYDVFLTLLGYLSAIFYHVEDFNNVMIQRAFLLNPVYVMIKYVRVVVMECTIPSIEYHVLCAFYALFYLAIGLWIYKRYNHEFVYYL
ncbi:MULTISPECIES: ABC transporter permease [unclassified Butyrivibrio]|uniref:ABC transporter permease n=1 Tax=unclassified Butyrivibrio TaxID=2639466 RepID=UPI00040B012B|nr:MULTISPECIES: ABC transporter permease [unclassified Butyrivibrio]